MNARLVLLGALAAGLAGLVTLPRGTAPRTDPADARPRTPPLWSDEFRGPRGSRPASSRWTLREGGAWAGGEELQAYTERPANVALDGRGNLRIVARRETYTGPDGITRQFTSGRLDTENHFSFHHGRVEARIKLPAGRGLLPAFWLLGQKTHQVGWPAGGEIDVVELLGQAPRVAHGSLHVPSDDASRARRLARTFRARRKLTDGFHRYAIDWRKGRIDFLVDGRRYGSFTRADLRDDEQWVFEDAFHLVLNLAVGNPWTGPPDARTRFPAVMLVDWVRVSPIER